ncbi:MAG: dihydroxyacetone kinase subunit DhaK [Erysipelotrichaceae bacterium]|jgi:dihydroxyacetone kinase-like protein|nr:dihydroxyacetone kinase subunit DhaK [Erysipelotrichaceae bacterium]MCH4045779.1 dihydroxyacetone kinase subunit DhaK [Erysipelotrichaceae bacterium]MCH4122987.1 dihydroxyacetone kinase subunit DhaK [Erysipelotrichaceae bacterium]MCI1384688.1 dihydroxyacetone kinase subunit DhaK [Solobacterium sp.]
MRKLINKPEDVVTDMLSGMAKANSDKLCWTGPETEVIYRKKKKENKTGIISGGGSGHEPLHAGYVGKGMLDAAVCGNVFASPSPDRIIEGLRKADSGKGVLMVIKNYSGDVMNFQMAGELAEMEGIHTDYVIVKDDVAVEDSDVSTGRRGIAGTVFVHKCAGAAAEEGKSLTEVKAVAEKVIANVRTMGMSLSACTIPANGKPNFEIPEGMCEIGMGIHGEPGIEKRPLGTAAEIAQILVAHILADKDFSGADVAVIVNGLGGTPLMELYIVYNEVEKILSRKGIHIYRSFVGNYTTSLEMAGCSISLLKLDDELKHYLDAPADTPAWKEF